MEQYLKDTLNEDVLEEIKPKLFNKRVRDIFKAFDKNKSFRLEFQEFYDFMLHITHI